MGKKGLLISALVLMVIIGSAGMYFRARAPVQNIAYTGQVQDIRIGNVGEYSIFNIIAQEKGYFAENGLNAQVIEYPSGPAAMQDLLAGKLDTTIGADFVGVRNIFARDDLRILAEVSKQQAFSLIARKDKGITTPADIKGKKVGVTRKGAGEFFLGKFLGLHDLSLKDITVADLQPAALSAQLATGTIDAAVIFDPHTYNLQKQLGANVTIFSVQGDQKTFALAYSTQEFIQNHPEIIQRYLRALRQAEDFSRANPEEAQRIVARDLHYDEGYIQYMWPRIDFTVALNQELLLSMEDQAAWAIENKLTEKKGIPNYLKYLYFDGLHQVAPSAVTIVH